MKINTKDIQHNWKHYTLVNDNGMEVSFLNYGGIITSIVVPDKNGNLENVVLGYKNYDDYLTNSTYFGALIGRIAGRIQDSNFELNGKTYSLTPNEGKNHLHGGSSGFHQVLWNSTDFQTESTVGVKLTHTSPDGEGGYPGKLDAAVTYELNNDNQFTISYEGTTTKTTVLTMTNHSYFNLSGDLKNTIQHHHITMDSTHFVELDNALIPTGRLLDATGTSFDFSNGREIMDGIESSFGQNIIAGNGYDHYFIFDHQKKESVVVNESKSGRILTIETDQPGMVMYTSNGLGNDLELAEGQSKNYLGVCFETQSSPASLHHEGFPSVVLTPDEKYESRTVFSFGVVKGDR
ncbi:aldose epimerase family protein [Virgibacillus oceani]|uniref:Aldose 1-epimerase n=1 Tax=Virgibacillus oceani TaxID=1479511 RepID=A0A917HAY3_9BACI|nr:aldose epimerase family protein [Virgibacillus oceani]GGG72702.1 aldose 1-epimerase [Virgibacillus oceani]